jgi:hypothetical protein
VERLNLFVSSAVDSDLLNTYQILI